MDQGVQLMEKYRGLPDSDWKRVRNVTLATFHRPIPWGLIVCCVALGVVLGMAWAYAQVHGSPEIWIDRLTKQVEEKDGRQN